MIMSQAFNSPCQKATCTIWLRPLDEPFWLQGQPGQTPPHEHGPELIVSIVIIDKKMMIKLPTNRYHGKVGFHTYAMQYLGGMCLQTCLCTSLGNDCHMHRQYQIKFQQLPAVRYVWVVWPGLASSTQVQHYTGAAQPKVPVQLAPTGSN